MRITIANAKGGVGKTTSAIYLAQAASMRGGTVTVLDADPQGSASQWADMAAQEDKPLDYEVLPANPATLSRPKATDGIEIVDAAPTGAGLTAAVNSADFVIVLGQPPGRAAGLGHPGNPQNASGHPHGQNRARNTRLQSSHSRLRPLGNPPLRQPDPQKAGHQDMHGA